MSVESFSYVFPVGKKPVNTFSTFLCLFHLPVLVFRSSDLQVLFFSSSPAPFLSSFSWTLLLEMEVRNGASEAARKTSCWDCWDLFYMHVNRSSTSWYGMFRAPPSVFFFFLVISCSIEMVCFMYIDQTSGWLKCWLRWFYSEWYFSFCVWKFILQTVLPPAEELQLWDGSGDMKGHTGCWCFQSTRLKLEAFSV